MSDTRAEFEAWYVTAAFDFERNPIGSRECGLQWASWQAARKAALAEAAKVCEDMHDEDRPSDYAYAIRALAEKTGKRTP